MPQTTHKPRKRNPERAAAVREAYGRLASIDAVAKELRLNPRTVRRDIVETGGQLLDPQADFGRPAELWEEGLTLNEIAEVLNHHKDWVKLRLVERTGMAAEAIARENRARIRASHRREIARLVQRFVEDCGEKPTSGAYDRYREQVKARTGAQIPDQYVVRRALGRSWSDVLSTVELPEDPRKAAIIAVLRELGDGVTQIQVRDALAAHPDTPTYGTVCQLLGPHFSDICRAAGITPGGRLAQAAGGTRSADTAQAEESVRAFFSREGHRPKIRDYEQMRREDPRLPAVTTLYKHYSSWKGFVALLPADPVKPPGGAGLLPVDASVAREVQRIVALHGGRCTVAQYHAARSAQPQTALPSLARIYVNCESFESFLTACCGDDLDPASSNRTSESERCASLLKARAELPEGQRLSTQAYERLRKNRPELGLLSSSVIRKHARTWNQGLQVAGISR